MGPYDWLTEEDGVLRADMAGTSPAEADRRLVIFQEITSGRLRLPPEEKEEDCPPLPLSGPRWWLESHPDRHGRDEEPSGRWSCTGR